jgi:hypothetical protein
VIISGNNSEIGLTIDNCKQALKESELEVEYLKGQLARADVLVKAKDKRGAKKKAAPPGTTLSKPGRSENSHPALVRGSNPKLVPE